MSAGNIPTVAPDASQSVLACISNEMVRVYKEQFGRGPTRARTRDSRMFFQYAAIDAFCEPVERLTGRRIRAFVSGIDTEVDGLSTETFILFPEGEGDGRSRAQGARL
jgi:hypothetical protein